MAVLMGMLFSTCASTHQYVHSCMHTGIHEGSCGSVPLNPTIDQTIILLQSYSLIVSGVLEVYRPIYIVVLMLN